MSARIFVEPEELVPGPLVVRGDEHHYLSKVRRLAVGTSICLLDGKGQMAFAEILGIGERETHLRVAEPEVVQPPAFSLSIAPALIKGERMDLAITKMVELGIQRISPIATERTVVRLKGDRAKSRLARFESLSRAAARQSRNPCPPRIDPIQSLESLLGRAPDAELLLIPEASGRARPLAEVLPPRPPASALVLIGPEGGFSAAELAKAREAGFTAVSLGPRVLRAETASIAAASILAFRYGDVGSI